MLFSFSFNRLGDSPFSRPSSVKPRINCAPFHAQAILPFDDTKSETVMFKISIISFISVLFRPCDPAAVFWAIISVVVNSIYFVFWAGAFTHIRIKVQERFPPTRANLNSLCSVFMIVRIAFARTPTDDACPNIINWRTFHSVSRRPFPSYFSSITATTFGSSDSQGFALEHTPKATVADTVPVGFTLVGFRESKNLKPAEPLVGNILEARIFGHRIGTRHDSYSRYELCSRAA